MSSYRDERAALQERVEALEEDLREAKRKADQADALGRDAADKQKEIDKLRAKLAKYEAPPQQPGKPAAAVLIALVIFMGAGAAASMFLRRPDVAPPPVAVAPVNALPEELPAPCEAYFRGIEDCVQRHPEMAALRDSIPQQREAFKAGLATQAGHDAIINTCERSLKTIQDSCK
jgi:hypothetical protein